MSLLDLFPTSSLICLGISILLISITSIYFIQKMSAQDHKIGSMLELVNAMAEELKQVNGRLLVAGQAQTYPISNYAIPMPQSQVSTSMPFPTNLIDVSDDEDEDDDEDDDEDVEDIEDDEEDDEEEEDESNICIQTWLVEEDEIPLENVAEELNIKTINLYENEDPAEDPNENEDINELDEINEINEVNETGDSLLEEPKVINILDYKKLSLNRLRSIVVEKGIVSDASKLKKNDLLKILEAE